ncbi:MAG: triacylglycerol lipase [Coriobacteriia bacterium]|nr:triacylglycerol lipase [Coriobacteriia bacterium]
MIIRRAMSYITILTLCSVVLLWEYALGAFDMLPRIGLGMVTLLLCALFVVVSIMPNNDKGAPGKLRQLGRGSELLLEAVVCATIVLIVFPIIGFMHVIDSAPATWVLNSFVAILVLGIVYLNGALRIALCSQQVALLFKVLLFTLCWVPVVNLLIFFAVYIPAHNEYRFGLFKYKRNLARQDQRVCGTRYPLLLVHGIFFRDWKLLNYWGRIPDELIANGATVYYGHQQSSASVESCARELAAQIMQIVKTSPHEKVNIIAHSKGGLDARFAVSSLGMDQYVASVTTISTPHQGCRFARKALENLPDALTSQVSRQYEKVFTLLGDKQPDFFGGVSELTDKVCADLNGRLPNKGGVLYQSVGTRMLNARSAGPPLNLGFEIVKTLDGDNDGLVAVRSMPWGESFQLVEPVGKRGISHADVIDQTRKDIKDFDVCELYVQIVQRLKERGL